MSKSTEPAADPAIDLLPLAARAEGATS